MAQHKISRALFKDLESNDFDVRDDYSGRGMYGRSCLGLTGSVRDLIRFVQYIEFLNATDATLLGVEDEGDPSTTEWLANVSSDSMGYDIIYYWPSVEVEK